jgi:hypothetical protein
MLEPFLLSLHIQVHVSKYLLVDDAKVRASFWRDVETALAEEFRLS